MMGGEFCVNATRAFAALLAEEGKLSPESGGLGGIVSVSGMPERLRVRVRRLAAHRFESSVLLDLPQAPPLENVAPGMYLVRVPGIAHLVLDAAAHPLPADKDRDTAALFARFGLLGEDAAGCIWLHREPSGLRITPFVWVRGTGTTYAETACGSRDIGCVHRLPGRLRRRGGAVADAAGRRAAACRAGRIRLSRRLGRVGRRACQAHSPGGCFCGMSGWRRENRGKGGETLLKKGFPSLPPDPHPSSSQDF